MADFSDPQGTPRPEENKCVATMTDSASKEVAYLIWIRSCNHGSTFNMRFRATIQNVPTFYREPPYIGTLYK